MDHPGPPGAALNQYRARHGVCDRLAAVIAERAGRNYLVTALAAVPLSTAHKIIDPAAGGFDPAGIPSGVGEALSKYLDRLPEQRQERDRGLLTALAYARGAELDDPAWLAFAAALGYSTTVADLDVLRRSRPPTTCSRRPSAERSAPGDPPVPSGPHRRAARHKTPAQRRRRAARHAPRPGREACGLAGPLPARARGRARRRRRPARSAPGGSAVPAQRRSGPASAPPRHRTICLSACRRRRLPAKRSPPRLPRPAGAGQPARIDRLPARLPAPWLHRIASRRPRPALANPLVPRSPGRRPGPHRPRADSWGGGRWRWGRCRTAPRSSSAAAMTARCGCGGWATAPRSGSP